MISSGGFGRLLEGGKKVAGKKKWTKSSDMAWDKKHGVKEGSKRDMAIDKRRGIKDNGPRKKGK